MSIVHYLAHFVNDNDKSEVMKLSNEKLTEQARLARNAYQRSYRKQNRDKIREINARYWQRKAAKAAEEAEDEQSEK